MRGKLFRRVLSLLLPLLILVGGLSLPAYAASDKEAFSDAVWRNGKYDSTLGDMAGRKLYVYGIVNSFTEIPEGGTDADIYLVSDDTATRLDTALYLYRICGTQPENECPFSDVPEGYTEAVAWLYEAGVTKGIGNNLYGVGSITEYQLLVMLSRYFGWESESYDAVFYLADSLELLPLGQEDDVFTYGELYQLLSAMIDRLVPERAVPVRPEVSIPESIALTAESYRSAEKQIRAALQYLPGTITVQFTDACPQEDMELFEQHYDWFYGDKELPIIGALNRSYVSPYFLTSYSNGRYKLWMSHYCDAYQAYSDSLNWLRVYEDTSYSEALTEFTAQYLAPIKSVSSQYDRVVKAHDLLCSLAAYDYSEYFNKDRPQAHDLLGFMESRKVVCDGYAKTFQWMLYYLGIDSYEVVGKATGEVHAWNKALLDGAWYNVDVCWDDSWYYRTFLLKSDTHFENNFHSFTDSFSKTAFASPSNY